MLLQTVYVFGPLLGTVVKRPLWFDFYKRPLTEVITKSSYVFAIWKFDCAGIKPGILKLHAFCVLPGGSQPRGMGGGGVLSIMAHTGRLRPKGIPFSGFRCMKG